MIFEVELRRKPTPSAVQNVRQKRVQVSAKTEAEAKAAALELNGNGRYFEATKVRKLLK